MGILLKRFVANNRKPCTSLNLLPYSSLLVPSRIFCYRSTMLYSTKALNFLTFYEIITRPKPSFVDLLTLEGRRRRDRRIPRESLHDYSDSAFKTLLDSNNDQSLLNGTTSEFFQLFSLYNSLLLNSLLAYLSRCFLRILVYPEQNKKAARRWK
jgi:hypothetical protein